MSAHFLHAAKETSCVKKLPTATETRRLNPRLMLLRMLLLLLLLAGLSEFAGDRNAEHNRRRGRTRHGLVARALQC